MPFRLLKPTASAVVLAITVLTLAACEPQRSDVASAQAILVYTGEVGSEPADPTADPLRFVVHDQDDEWMYGTFIVQDRDLNSSFDPAQEPALTQAQFEQILDGQVALAHRLDRLVGSANGRFGAPPDTRQAVMAIPQVPVARSLPVQGWSSTVVPDPMDGADARRRIMEWFMAEVAALSTGPSAETFEHLDITGTYWTPEALVTRPNSATGARMYDDTLMRAWVVASHDRGLWTWWAPYHGAPRSLDANKANPGSDPLEVDHVAVQPSYAFHSFLDGGRLTQARVRRDGPILLGKNQTGEIELRGESTSTSTGEAEDIVSRRLLYIAAKQGWAKLDRSTITFSAGRIMAMAARRPSSYAAVADLLHGRAVESPDPEPPWTRESTAAGCVATATFGAPEPGIAALLVHGIDPPAAGARVAMTLTASRGGTQTQRSWAVAPDTDGAWALPLDTSPLVGDIGQRQIDRLRLEILGAPCPPATDSFGLPNLQVERDPRLQWTHPTGPSRSWLQVTPGGAAAVTTDPLNGWSANPSTAERARLTDGVPAHPNTQPYGPAAHVTSDAQGTSTMVVDLGAVRTVTKVQVHLAACRLNWRLVWPTRVSATVGAAPTFGVSGSGAAMPSGGAKVDYEDTGWQDELGNGTRSMEDGCSEWVDLPMPTGTAGRFASVTLHSSALAATDELRVLNGSTNVALGIVPWVTPPVEGKTVAAFNAARPYGSAGAEVHVDDGRRLGDGIGAIGYAPGIWTGFRAMPDAWYATQELATPVEAGSIEVWFARCCGASAPVSAAGAAPRIEWTADGTTWHGADLSTATVLHGNHDTSTGYSLSVPAANSTVRMARLSVPANATPGWSLLSEIVVRPK